MIRILFNQVSAFKTALANLSLLCIALGLQAETIQTLEKIELSPNDSGVLVTVAFTPQVPEDFITYYIMDKDNPILVTEFSRTIPQKSLFTNTIRPVNHIQILYDTINTTPLLQSIFYLEKVIPYRYRWHNNQFQIELLWKELDISTVPQSYLLDIACKVQDDSSSEISFIFDTLAQDISISLSVDRRNIITKFYNTEAASDLQPSLATTLLNDIQIIRGTSPTQKPFAKVLIKSPYEIMVNKYSKKNTWVLSVVKTVPKIITSIQDTGSDLAAVKDTTETQIALEKSKKHKKWTYIGIGSGIAVGGAILGIILGNTDNDKPAGNGAIPDIDVDLPDQ